jgi:glycosyltransferase involved in cell wall biosynthesis
MYFTIIINTHNQYETFDRCLKSCLNQKFQKEYEIIISDTSDNKKIIDDNLLKSRKIHYYHYNNFSKHSEINQIKKIFEVSKFAKGKWFFLLDGDDFFEENKLQFIYENYKLENYFLVQDKCFYYKELNGKSQMPNNRIYKNNFFYKKLINFWPEIYATSCLFGNTKMLHTFFNDIDINKWDKLAIDAQLILYSLYKKNYKICKTILTNKSIGNKNLSLKYKFFNNNYWKRRYQQIIFWEELSQKKIYNLDKFICKLIKSFI